MQRFLLLFTICISTISVVIAQNSTEEKPLPDSIQSAKAEVFDPYLIRMDDYGKVMTYNSQYMLYNQIPGVMTHRSETSLLDNASSLVSRNPSGTLGGLDHLLSSNIYSNGTISPLGMSFHPDDYESFGKINEIDAALEYGAMSTNGVFTKNLKLPQKNQPLSVSYHSQMIFSQPTSDIPVMSAEQFRETVQTYYADQPNALNLLGDANTDWSDQILENTFNYSQYVSASGSFWKGQIPVKASFTTDQFNGAVKNTYEKSNVGSLIVSPRLLDDKLKIDALIQYGLYNMLDQDYSIGSYFFIDPTQDYQETVGNWDYGFLENDEEDKFKGFTSSVSADYQLPIKGLGIRAGYLHQDFEYQTSTRSYNLWESINSAFYFQSTFAKQFDLFIEAGYKHMNQEHIAKFLYNEEWRKSDHTQTYKKEFYGKMNLSYLDMISLRTTLSRLGSSKYNQDNRYVTLPAAKLGFDFTEAFPSLQEKSIDHLAINLGYAKSTNYDIYTLMFSSDLLSEGFNKDLTNPITTIKSFSLNLGLFKNRLQAQAEIYQKNTNDFLEYVYVPSGSNLVNYLLKNLGEIENKGYEISLKAVPVQTHDLVWKAQFSFSKNNNEMVEYYPENPDYIVGNDIYVKATGQSVYSFYLYEQVYDENGDPMEGLYVDQNNDGVIDNNDRYFAGSTYPDHVFSFNSTINYKQFSFFIAAHAWTGHQIFDYFGSQYGYKNYIYHTSYLSNTFEDVAFNTKQEQSDYYLIDADFLKIDNITLSYQLPKLINNKIDVEIYGAVNNVVTLSESDYLDPEHFGYLYYVYPNNARSYIFGIQAQF